MIVISSTIAEAAPTVGSFGSVDCTSSVPRIVSISPESSSTLATVLTDQRASEILVILSLGRDTSTLSLNTVSKRFHYSQIAFQLS